MITSWKTTVGGVLAMLGLSLSTVKDPAWVGAVGTILAAIGTGITGLSARDFNKSSEESGVKPGPK